MASRSDPAVVARDVDAHEAQLRKLRDRLGGELVPLVPPPRVRGELLVGELAAHLVDHLVLLGKVGVARVVP